MKIIDAILILLILATGAGYYYLSSRPGNCNNGQILLTTEVKALIDAELLKVQSRDQEITGLRDLMAKITVVEQQYTELDIARSQNRDLFKKKLSAVHAVSDRKRAFDAELKEYVTKMKNQARNSCTEGQRPKL